MAFKLFNMRQIFQVAFYMLLSKAAGIPPDKIIVTDLP